MISNPLIPVQGGRWPEPPRGAEITGRDPTPDMMSSHRGAHSHPHLDWDRLDMPGDLHVPIPGTWEESQYPEQAHTDAGRAYQLHTDRGLGRQSILLFSTTWWWNDGEHNDINPGPAVYV